MTPQKWRWGSNLAAWRLQALTREESEVATSKRFDLAIEFTEVEEP